MAFVVKALFLSALVYTTHAGHQSVQRRSDSFASAALSSPSASYGPPSRTYGPPHGGSGDPIHIEESVVDDHGPISGSAPGPIVSDHGPTGGGFSPITGPGYNGGYNNGGLNAGPITSGPGPISTGPGSYSSDPGYSEGSLLLDSNLPGAGTGPAATTNVGPPRVIGTSVSVGRPDVTQTRYELQSVVQNVVRRVPVEVTRHIQVAVPQPVPVPVRQEVKVPVPQPYPVHVDVVKQVPYPVYKTQHVEVERPVPYEVIKQVPVEVIREIPVPVDRPYEVIKKVPVHVEKRVEVPVAVWKPYPLHIIKHVTHYKKKSCCW